MLVGVFGLAKDDLRGLAKRLRDTSLEERREVSVSGVTEMILPSSSY